MKYYLKEEFLHDNNVKNAGNKARNDVEEIVKREGYQALVLSVDNWYEMSTVKAQLHKSKAFGQALDQLQQGDELLIQFPMLHHSFFTTHHVKKAQKKGVKVNFIIHDLEALRYVNVENFPLKHKIRIQIQESGLLGAADGIIAHNPIMKSVLVDKGIAEDKIVSLGIFDYLIPNFQEKTGLSKNQPIIVAGNLAQEKAGYLYSLPAKPAYNLYGVGFDESRALENEALEAAVKILVLAGRAVPNVPRRGIFQLEFLRIPVQRKACCHCRNSLLLRTEKRAVEQSGNDSWRVPKIANTGGL